MEISKRMAMTGIAIATLLLLVESSRASRIPRVELLRDVSVAGAQVELSDLLPASASASLRARASAISLGAAPQPGNLRVLARDAIERGAGANAEVLLEISVPEQIVISRDVRPITLAEVATAVRVALARDGAQAADAVQPEDIFLGTQVFVSPGDSGLRVMSAEFDRGLQRARFLLWPSRDPKVLPFFVTARLKGWLPSNPIRPAMGLGPVAGNTSAPFVPARTPQREILVAQGEHATLLLRAGALQMLVDVISLERGSLGQQVDVRVVDGGKILAAVVDGRAHLEGKF